MAARQPRSKRKIEPDKGLHLLKRDFQKKYMADQCRQLTQRLDEAIEATRRAARVRRRPYLPDRTNFASAPRGKEAVLERALHAYWSIPDVEPVADCWHAIVEFQVNMADRRKRGDGWGEIDLLGLAADGLPIVIEVKADASAESPAQLLVQAAAYGVALQKAWPTFRAEWQRKIVMRRMGENCQLPDALTPCRLVCAAPANYWKQWRGVPPSEWESLAELVASFTRRNLPATFVSLEQRYTASPLSVGAWQTRGQTD